MPEVRVKRILMTGDTLGGVWTYAVDLARALGELDIEVVLATLGGEHAGQREEAAAIPNLRLFTSSYKLEWMEDPWRDVEESGRWLLDLEKAFAPDVVHLNTYAHGALPWNSPVVLTAHSCVVSWWSAVKREPLPDAWSRYRDEVRRAIQSVDLITAPSRAMLRTLRMNYGSALPPARVVANGRSDGQFRAGAKEPLVLTAGRLWDEAKNVAAVVRVAAALPWPVFVAGEERHPSGKSIELAGCQSLGRLSPGELAGWYSRAAIYALPARYEPFGLSVLEAALSGCALVLGDIESLREIWGDTAIFVPPHDEDALESALRGLMEDAARRQDLARRSLARALTFTSRRMAAGYAEVYREIAGTRSIACAS